MSICCMVNEKFRENVPAWEVNSKLSYFIALTLAPRKPLQSSRIFLIAGTPKLRVGDHPIVKY